jgi:hypothetical protein
MSEYGADAILATIAAPSVRQWQDVNILRCLTKALHAIDNRAESRQDRLLSETPENRHS